jgi:hypothetical protein
MLVTTFSAFAVAFAAFVGHCELEFYQLVGNLNIYHFSIGVLYMYMNELEEKAVDSQNLPRMRKRRCAVAGMI